MPTFPRGFANFEANARNAQLLVKLAREQGGNVAEERKRLQAGTAVDHVALRGLPAIGPGVPGVIRGTQPEAAAISAEQRRRVTAGR